MAPDKPITLILFTTWTKLHLFFMTSANQNDLAYTLYTNRLRREENKYVEYLKFSILTIYVNLSRITE
jgi:hypothetical protein